MTVPSWFTFGLLALAAFRTYRLLAEDTVLDWVRLPLVGLPRGWKEGDPVPKSYRERLAVFIECPWCMGFWVSLGWWGAYELWQHGTVVAAFLAALSGAVGLIAKLDQ